MTRRVARCLLLLAAVGGVTDSFSVSTCRRAEASSALRVARTCVLLGDVPQQAPVLADRLGLPLLDPCTVDLDVYTHALVLEPLAEDDYKLGLVALESPSKTGKPPKRIYRMNPLVVDWGSCQQRSGKDNLVATIPGNCATAHDWTAGLGQDAQVLARHVPSVTLFERNPIVAALLQDGLRRARVNVDLVVGDSQECDNRRPDLIYLDPMFPPRTKQASVKKNMQLLHALLDTQDSDEEARYQQEARLLDSALDHAIQRVVVKRPSHSEPLGGHTPSFVVKGAISRWDVYAL